MESLYLFAMCYRGDINDSHIRILYIWLLSIFNYCKKTFIFDQLNKNN